MRPAHATRNALLDVLRAGAQGDFDSLASRAGVDPVDAQVTLANLRREGKAVVRRMFTPLPPDVRTPRSARGRPRVVYALVDAATREAHHQVLAQALASWR